MTSFSFRAKPLYLPRLRCFFVASLHELFLSISAVTLIVYRVLARSVSLLLNRTFVCSKTVSALFFKTLNVTKPIFFLNL